MVIPPEQHVVWALRKAKSEQDGGASMILVFSRWYFRFLKDIVSLYHQSKVYTSQMIRELVIVLMRRLGKGKVV